MNTTDHAKLRLTLHSQLLGLAKENSNYYMTVAAFSYAEKHHQGMRKDGVTPEFNHQLNILGILMTQIANIKQPWLVLALILLHDTLEDNNHLEDEIITKFPVLFPYVNRISKVRRGQKLSNAEYYAPMPACFVVSVAKGSDRLHNLTTMMGVFTIEKLDEAVVETEEFVLPMLKLAKHEHPEQNAIYELIKSLINIQLNSIRQYIALSKKVADQA
jgi:(p)ppGpp synthase/HD superfamily hydrolase